MKSTGAGPNRLPARHKQRRTNKKCPIGSDRLNIASLSHDLVYAIRKLRRDLAACRTCETYRAGPDDQDASQRCPLLSEFSGWVSQAIQEVLEEWEFGVAGNDCKQAEGGF